MWTTLFDKIYLINLSFRKERLGRSEKELQKFNIPYEIVPAYLDCADGRNGLYTTMIGLFRDALIKGYQHILVFEDDVKILREDFNEIMDACIEQLPYYDQLYLGGNIPEKFYAKRYSHNLLKVTRCLSTHAVAYNWRAMEKIINLPKDLPIDKLIADKLHHTENIYFAYPLLCSQYPGYSDIYKCPFDNRELIDGRFEKVDEYLKQIEKQETRCP